MSDAKEFAVTLVCPAGMSVIYENSVEAALETAHTFMDMWSGVSGVKIQVTGSKGTIIGYEISKKDISAS